MAGQDQVVMERIEQLADEEHELYAKESRGEASTRERARLREIQVELDRCYDVLRQRRARRAAGLDPDGANVRDEPAIGDHVG
jgi:peptide subunit release factor 1 (eRF1)